jgi:hypothetical protein
MLASQLSFAFSVGLSVPIRSNILMQMDINAIRQQIIQSVLAKQDDSFRWGFDKKQANERPEYLYYSPNFRSTLWTLVLLADIKTPTNIPQVARSLRLISEHFVDLEHGIFRLPNMGHFPIPCLNGNMIYLHHYFKSPHSHTLQKTIDFFAQYQRFDDGDFRTPKSFPYYSNISCYGRHTCYWGVAKLLKGLSFIPKRRRTPQTQRLVENCIDFILHHEVCFSSKNSTTLLHPDIAILCFPNFYKSDFLEVLWLLARERVRDKRIFRALKLLQAKMKNDGCWELEKPVNTIVPFGSKGCSNFFITERATEVLGYYQG